MPTRDRISASSEDAGGPARRRNKGSTHLHADRDGEFLEISVDRALSLGLSKRHEQQVSPGRSNATRQGLFPHQASAGETAGARFRRSGARDTDRQPFVLPLQLRRHPPAGTRESPVLPRARLDSKIMSEPATRSGSGVFCRREAQTSGMPSATINAARSLISLRSGLSWDSMA